LAEEEKKAMRRVTPDQEEAPGAVVSPQHPGTVPDRSTIPGQWSERVPRAAVVRRPLTEYGTAQHIADVYAPSGEGGVWTPRDFEQAPAAYEELRRADPRLLPPQRPVPGYETLRALAQMEERAALAARRTEELAARAESAATAGGEADHAISQGQAAEATQPDAVGGSEQPDRRGEAAGTVRPEAPPTPAEVAAIPSAATPLAAAGAASGPPAAGELWTGTTDPQPPVLPPDQQTTSRTGLAAPAEAVANAAAAVAPPTVPSEPEKVVGTAGAGQADQDRSRWAEAAPPPGVRTGVAVATETGATGTAAPGIGGPGVPEAPIAPATDATPDARPANVTSYDLVGGQLAGLQAAAADVPADIPTPAEGWSAGGGDAVEAGTIPTAAAVDAPSGRTGDIAPGGTSTPETGWGTTIGGEPGAGGHAGSPSVGENAGDRGAAGSPATRRAIAGGESIVVPSGTRRAGGAEPAIVAPESEPEPPSTRIGSTSYEAALSESGVGDAAALGGPGGVAGPGVAEGSFRPTAAPVARDVEPDGGPIGAGERGRVALDPTPAPPTPPGSVASVTEAGIVGAEAVPVTGQAAAPAGAVRGGGSRHCPPGYPVKALAASREFHLPRTRGYDRITPEFCFKSAEAAGAAGYTPAR